MQFFWKELNKKDFLELCHISIHKNNFFLLIWIDQNHNLKRIYLSNNIYYLVLATKGSAFKWKLNIIIIIIKMFMQESAAAEPQSYRVLCCVQRNAEHRYFCCVLLVQMKKKNRVSSTELYKGMYAVLYTVHYIYTHFLYSLTPIQNIIYTTYTKHTL